MKSITQHLTSKALDGLAKGPAWSIPSSVTAPSSGERCHRCHRSRPPFHGCALCAPENLPLLAGRRV